MNEELGIYQDGKIKGKKGECLIQDCLPIIKQLPNKAFKFCLTDPPYSVNAKYDNQRKKSISNTGKVYDRQEQINYEDNMEWNDKIEIMEQCFRIAEVTLFTPGLKEFTKWINYKEPTEILYWNKINCFGKKDHFININCEPILCYGNIDHQFPFRSNVIRQRLNNGFLRHESDQYIHPHPKPTELYFSIIDNYTKPIDSIIDVFAGSGTTCEVAESLDYIKKWLAFEIKPDYTPDISKRIKRAIINNSSKSIMEKYLNV